MKVRRLDDMKYVHWCCLALYLLSLLFVIPMDIYIIFSRLWFSEKFAVGYGDSPVCFRYSAIGFQPLALSTDIFLILSLPSLDWSMSSVTAERKGMYVLYIAVFFLIIMDIVYELLPDGLTINTYLPMHIGMLILMTILRVAANLEYGLFLKDVLDKNIKSLSSGKKVENVVASPDSNTATKPLPFFRSSPFLSTLSKAYQ
jgi:hypothetical protein